jgi:hypothetical protein
LRTWAWWSSQSSRVVTAAVSEELSPVVDGTVGAERGRSALVAAHDQLQQVVGGRVRQLEVREH